MLIIHKKKKKSINVLICIALYNICSQNFFFRGPSLKATTIKFYFFILCILNDIIMGFRPHGPPRYVPGTNCIIIFKI